MLQIIVFYVNIFYFNCYGAGNYKFLIHALLAIFLPLLIGTHASVPVILVFCSNISTFEAIRLQWIYPFDLRTVQPARMSRRISRILEVEFIFGPKSWRVVIPLSMYMKTLLFVSTISMILQMCSLLILINNST